MITSHVWRSVSKSAFLDFIPVSSSRCPCSFYIQIVVKKKHLGCLINKTVGPQNSLCCLPTGISKSVLSALMVSRYLDSDIFLWFPRMCCVLLHQCFYFQELAEHFVPSGRHVKHVGVKVCSSWSVMPNLPYYFVEMSECRQ